MSAFEAPIVDGPRQIAPGPDGNLWFTTYYKPGLSWGSVEIGRITPAGVITMFPSVQRDGSAGIAPGPDGNEWFTNLGGSSLGTISATDRPSAPRALTAVAGNGSLTATWSAPASDGGSPITGYTVSASPGGSTCTWTTGPLSCTIAGLANGAAYTLTITATNAAGGGVASMATPPFVPTRFRDVGVAAPFYADIEWLGANGISSGYDDGTFRPNDPISRQAMAAFLYRRHAGAGAASACSSAPFSDVPIDAPFCGEIAWMKAAGITHGYADGTFHPQAPVARLAMAAFLYRFSGNQLGAAPACSDAPFTDVPVTSSFCGEIAWIKSAGITTGYPDGSFHPGDPVTRQAMAAFLHRLA